MLDKLDLVHMNGRIYDPLVARFISADPIIQDPEHSQSYNRYTYVWNNPTNLTDPTGFATGAPPDVVLPNSATVQACDNGIYCRVNNGVPTYTGPGESQNNNKLTPSKDRASVALPSANSGTPNQPEKNYGDHWAEYKRDVPSSGGDGPSTNATGYDDWARGKGYMSQEQWSERAAARGAGAAIGIGVVAGGAAVAKAPAIGGGIVAGFKRLFGLGKSEVQFGNVENQVNHAFRHIDKAGLDRTAVQQAIRQDVSRAAESLSKGQQYSGNVVVNGTRIEYSAFKLENGTINVGRITPPRP